MCGHIWEGAVAYGVAASDFWHMTPAELNVHIKGYTEKMKMKSNETNFAAWLIGAYVRLAVASVIDSEVDYPEKPCESKENESAEPWQAAKIKMAGYAANVDRALAQKASQKGAAV